MPKWVSTAERMPTNQEHEPCNNYHFVLYDWGNDMKMGKAIAMYMDGEWWINYTAKLVKPVKFWLEDDTDT